MRYVAFFIIVLAPFIKLAAQQQPRPALSGVEGPVYVDKQGVLRWTKDRREAAFFGVNYTVPFAYGYRSHKALGIDIEKAIDADVYHFARLGLDAFRVHVWDVEISDSLGNLLENEHLRLFDYLLMKLKEQNIKILITPIAFWGNGYPERDEKTPGFSTVYGKGPAVVKEEAIKAQENYLRQFFKHVNPYTKLSYTNDPDVIAMEINNEPHHSGPKEKTTEYVNRLTAAVKSAGWKKPVYYNISESYRYGDAIVKAGVEGHSFQWYPTGLVANHEQQGNFLPNADLYYIPFNDTIPAYANRARMVYEFDAGDVMQPVMYPAMARSYRTAGFQWATQFAYDPMHTAYANTEYQTHYLNLAYTPAKAISLMIASKIFHHVPRLKSYGAYPTDTLFDVFRVSYKEQVSEMNSDTAFYYTCNTSTNPLNVSVLKHVAGTGSSPVVKYEGRGAYFLDKLPDGSWRLEVMPDAIPTRDPFEKASPRKEVTRIEWRANKMKLSLPGITNETFAIRPGVYKIGNTGIEALAGETFYAPPAIAAEPLVVHTPYSEVSAGRTFFINAVITATDSSGRVSVEMRNSSNKWRTVQMQRVGPYDYKAEVPADMLTPGLLQYRIMIHHATKGSYTFPGGFDGDPYAWDEYRNETWQTFVATAGNALELFNATNDRNKVMLYNPDWRNNTVEYTTTERPRQLALRTAMTRGQLMGWQFYFAEKISGRKAELPSFTKIIIRARSQQETSLKLALITADADAYSTSVPLTKEWRDIEVPLSSLQHDSFLLLPRPYPGFLPLTFKGKGTRPLNLSDAEKIEVSFGAGSVEVEAVWLK